MEASARFRAAVETGERSALEDLFTQDIRFCSPVKFIPFKGKPVVLGLFNVLLRTPGLLGCPRRTFREQVPGLLERYQRRVSRLAGQLGFMAKE
ncbi:hypothetical protein OHN37_33405 [Streptomyces sp. NBC_00485]|uniref:hypothetical protein n=1 Tax=unclassified Streptomyces TaxID=2593676 RepID=UPI002E189BDA